MLTGRISKRSVLKGKLSNPDPRYIEGDHVYKKLAENEYPTVTNTAVSGIGYTSADSLSFDGTQYVVTEFKPTNDTKIEIDFMRTAASGQKFLFGSRTTSARFALMYYASTLAYPMFGSMAESISETDAEADVFHTASLGQDGYYLDGIRKKTFEDMSFNCVYDIYIGTVNLAGSADSRMFIGNIYAVRIYEAGTLVYELLPAVSADGRAGLYDIIGKQFYERITN